MCLSTSPHRAKALGDCRGVARRPANHENGVVAADRAGDLCQPRTVDSHRQRLRLPGIGPQDEQLLDRFLRPEIFLDRAPESGLASAARSVEPARRYAPSTARLTSPSSRISRDSVA